MWNNNDVHYEHTSPMHYTHTQTYTYTHRYTHIHISSHTDKGRYNPLLLSCQSKRVGFLPMNECVLLNT